MSDLGLGGWADSKLRAEGCQGVKVGDRLGIAFYLCCHCLAVGRASKQPRTPQRQQGTIKAVWEPSTG